MAKKVKVIIKKLRRERILGQAFIGYNEIEIDPRLKPLKYFEVLIHEYMHLLFPMMSETEVSKKARLMAKFLWSQQYRRVSE